MGNRLAVNKSLQPYKTPSGQANYPALFSIPTSERLPEMAKKDFQETFILVCAAITMASESMNLKRGLNAAQIEELTDIVLETCAEDNLSLEDFVLFLQRLVRGEYGTNYESMDVPKFMERFEAYREERFQAIKAIRDEQHANYSPDYHDTRISEQSQREESMKNIAAVIEYSKLNASNGQSQSNNP